ncbi:MAG: ATPase, T2SS/T4P/T4SS family [Anaerocolumna sp.]
MDTQKQELQDLVIREIDLSRELKDEEILEVIDEILLSKSKSSYISMQDKRRLRKEIFNSIRRLDILQELVEDTSITEIMINGANNIFIEQNGAIRPWKKQFESSKKLEDVVQQIVSKSNRIINESSPIVDARLPDGSRVNIVLPPVALEGPVVTIRKFPDNPITIKKLIEIGSISDEAACFLEKLVIAGYNIFISGGTGSGKTTFLNALSNFIPKEERVITIEDSAELQIRSIPNLVKLEARNANVEGKNSVTIRDLIKSSLRMRPEGITIINTKRIWKDRSHPKHTLLMFPAGILTFRNNLRYQNLLCMHIFYYKFHLYFRYSFFLLFPAWQLPVAHNSIRLFAYLIFQFLL